MKNFLTFPFLHQTKQLILMILQTDVDSELFDLLPFDKLDHKQNVISWEHKKRAVNYWDNTKGGKPNRKLKFVQTSLST